MAVTETFPWNGNSLVDEQYRRKNYKVEDTGNKTGRVIIFFSGNGLYYPNEEQVFKDVVIDRDRYEFEKISKGRLIRKYYEKIIFLRDIYKQWYITGINADADNIEKTSRVLNELTAGMEVTTAGISAGGYAAVVFGILIGARRVFDISGQWYPEITEKTPFLKKYEAERDRNTFLDVRNILNEENSKKIYYFYPAGCEEDIEQNGYVRDYPFKRFAVDTDIHGALLRYETFNHLFVTSDDKMDAISEKYAGQRVSAEVLFDETVPLNYRITYRARHASEMLKQKLIHENPRG